MKTQNPAEIWDRAERLFEANDYDGTKGRIAAIQGIRTERVCLVSVHGINHYAGIDESERKIADLYTGGLVRALGHLTGVMTIYNCSRRPEINPYLGDTAADKAIRQLIQRKRTRVVLDIHGAKDNEFFDIAIGTGGAPLSGPQRRVLRFLVPRLCEKNLAVAINSLAYSAKKPVTIVARHRNEPGVCVLQVEIVRRLRNPKTEAGTMLITVLGKIVSELARAYRR